MGSYLFSDIFIILILIFQFFLIIVAADVIAREFKPEKILKRISMGDSFMKSIITKGKLLYESPAK